MIAVAKEAEIAKVIATYLTAYPQSKIEPTGLVLYAKALKDYSPSEIEAAMTKLLAVSKFFPSVSEIIEQVRNVRGIASESPELTAAEAWGEVVDYVKHKGIYQSWPYSRPEVKEAVRQFGGREELCLLEMDTVGVARAQFMRIYDSIVQREKDRGASKWAISQLSATKRAELMQHNIQQLAEGTAKALAVPGSEAE